MQVNSWMPRKELYFFIIRIVFPGSGSDCPLPISIQAQYNVQCTKWTFLRNISVLSSGLTVKTWWIKEVLLKAAPTITGSWWRRRRRGWRVEELHCDQHSHPFPLHPSPCPPIGHPWSAGQTLASYWWRMERGILENFASISTGGGEGAAGTWHWAATALNNTE